ncbi:MAG: dynamin family protein [Desulfobacterales bacterium]|nr:dynamin family protein [Desulfobacterales bacterium]
MSINIIDAKYDLSDKLLSLKKKLSIIENNYKIDISELIDKIERAINNVKNDIFSIAFFGAFSDGKSTILSALIRKLDISISPEPTTDKIQPYKFEDYQVIDTPGLFSENLIHDELTKKYISEANIIIYTVDPVNPLKNSHMSIIKWILNDLKKYDSTIFVINKMDEIADLEDDNDFYKNSEIKKHVVSEIIKDVTGIDKNNKIICVAADPFEQGLDFWQKNIDDYRRLSRLEMLESIISDFKTTYRNELVLKAGVSIIRDASLKVVNELNMIRNSLVSEVDLLKNQIEEYNNRLKVLDSDINRNYINIKEDFISFREDVLIEIDSIGKISELNEFVQNKIGKDGYIIQEKIDLIIRKHTANLLSESKQLFESLEESLVYHSKIQDELLDKLSEAGKSIMKTMLSAPTRKIANAVIKAKDFLKIPFKFKPWGALKFAKFLKAMPVVIEAIELICSVWSKFKIEKKRNEIKSEIENAFKGLIQNLSLDNYIDTYFPFIAETRNVLISLNESKTELNEAISNIDKIIYEMNIELA